MDVARERVKPCTLITTMVAPWWDSTTDFSLRYHEKNQTVYFNFEIKVADCEDMLFGYKKNSQPFDTVVWFINHITVTWLYMCAYVETEHPIRIMHKLNFLFHCGLNFRRLK